MKILVTGGAGYIGSHTSVQLLEAGYDIVIADNLCNSSEEAVHRIAQLTGKAPAFYKIDLRNETALDQIFSEHKIDAVIHFAGLKAVGESVAKPIEYYENNLGSTLSLCKIMTKHGVKKIVFSSSATVYGKPDSIPIREDFPLSCTNPYGQTKLMIEQILQDLYVSDPQWNIALLRYFNPVGAHKSGMIGEDPKGIPNNLVPYIAQVAIGKLDHLRVFGSDYDTPDGTGVRDYIHVEDLANGHLKALEKLNSNVGVVIYNLGTGHGYSVLDMVKAFEKACGKTIPYELCDRRPGDIATCYADPQKAKKELGFEALRGLDEMCEDTWRWQQQNPNGYEK
ncbi:UDP-glucose 4-epimerase GalE [Ructibacterium gallinarum]|uniref:UDP-glucose 4-epimerase n=1 Tax=Ructibacterium gallinarum TaxID=2779355 RepID=A0A9D5R7W6_9FIRM|nr:UDP-glucose 4-epimerase GalE [Ructibacterium gallinarum]MBE5039686.1 UDP-glucose 4-epimerase GalE [Ructibacterium gallinarum]